MESICRKKKKQREKMKTKLGKHHLGEIKKLCLT